MNVAVIGAGSWGTALAIHLQRAGCAVRIWAREAEIVAGVAARRRNPLFLSDFELPDGIVVSGDLAPSVADAEAVVFVVPVQFARALLRELKPLLPPGAPLISASKGIEIASLQRMDEIVRAELGLPARGFVALSGPSFAREVAAGYPTAAVLAGRDAALLRRLQAAFSTSAFRFYSSTDVAGAELAGALKNVVAIGAGVAEGLGLGQNALAALLTRGLHEIARLGVRLGGREETFRGLAGMGDLVLTCAAGSLSRNRAVGERLGRGEKLEAILAGREVAEGVPTTRAAAELARRHKVEMPITFAVEAILAGALPPRDAVTALMTRELKDEASL
ncbi:MAG TPA: NAD(P)H-dependent glycerol-3-phosphate dehydrogenase [Thermoanaerobaculaceae bacterium]|nr:NAD(P)H-dependent glycerol-3-phosphate dehydrogenase [Thermoanaerobaculaceae bacterium]